MGAREGAGGWLGMAEREMRNRSLFASVHRCGGTDDGCRDEASAGAMTNVQES